MKKRYILILIILFSIVFLTHESIIAYLFDEGEKKGETTIGLVDVDYDIYFMHNDAKIVADYVNVNASGTIRKTGVFRADAITPSNQRYITKLRVDIKIKSNVDSYVRVKMSPAVVLTQQGIGQQTGNSIVFDYALFNTTAKWHGHRDENNLQHHYYYEDPVKEANGEITIPFIIEMTEPFDPLNPGYSIEIKLELEAVQALNGPQNNWGFATKPWNGGSWT